MSPELPNTRPQKHPLVGQHIGPCVVTALLNASPRCETFSAMHLALNRSVAIKIVQLDERRELRLRRRFMSEARQLAALSHPNIVTVHDLGSLENGRVYIVMELLEGEPLHRVQARHGTLALPLATRIARELARAFMTIHQADIICGALHLHHVMITGGPLVGSPFHGANWVKLMGLRTSRDACLAGRRGIGAQPHTLSTPLAPEVLAGENPDTRSDVFALSALLTHLLYGRHSLSALSSSADNSDLAEADCRSLDQEPRPAVTVALNALLQRCLSRRPADRPASMRDFLTALDHALGVQGRRSSPSYLPTAAPISGPDRSATEEM